MFFPTRSQPNFQCAAACCGMHQNAHKQTPKQVLRHAAACFNCWCLRSMRVVSSSKSCMPSGSFPLQLAHLCVIFQRPESPDTAGNKVPTMFPRKKGKTGKMGENGEKVGGIGEKEEEVGENGEKILVKWGEMGSILQTREKLGEDTGKNSSPLFPIFPPPCVAQYTHPLCPISTENHRFPPFWEWFTAVFALVFPKTTHLHPIPPFPPIFPPAVTQYTHPLCPISTENHHFPPFGGLFINIFPLSFQKKKNNTFSPRFPPLPIFSHVSE